MHRAVVSAGLPLLIAAHLQAGSPARGKILYARQSEDGVVLHVMNADGSGDLELPGQSPGFNLLPTWSPDGKRLAYMFAGRQEAPRVVVGAADGSNRTVLNAPAGAAAAPAFSPDGKQLAFISGEGPGVYLSDADGGNARLFSPAGTTAVFPFWNRDGKAVGYTRRQGEGGEIVLAKVDGSSEEVLTQTGKFAVAGANGLSPDGKRLAFLAMDRPARTGSLRVLDLAGKVETTLCDLKLDHVGQPVLTPTPAWSPDGRAILIPIATEKGIPLFAVSDDGKTRTRLTPEDSRCLQAAWWGPG